MTNYPQCGGQAWKRRDIKWNSRIQATGQQRSDSHEWLCYSL